MTNKTLNHYLRHTVTVTGTACPYLALSSITLPPGASTTGVPFRIARDLIPDDAYQHGFVFFPSGQEHAVAVRRVGSQWVELDSLTRAPQHSRLPRAKKLTDQSR
ncbi:MAG: hypothetical protein ACK56I_02235, partial [bacterium]